MLPGAAAYRVFVPVEEDIEVRVLLLQFLDPIENLGQAHIGRLIEDDMDLLLHSPTPVPVPWFVIGPLYT